MDIQYEYNSCLDRLTDYARQTGKADSQKVDHFSVDHSFLADDSSSGAG